MQANGGPKSYQLRASKLLCEVVRLLASAEPLDSLAFKRYVGGEVYFLSQALTQ